MVDKRNAFKCMVIKTQGHIPLGRTSGRWEDVKGTGRECVDWAHLVQVRGQWRALVNTVIDLRDPQLSAVSPTSFLPSNTAEKLNVVRGVTLG
jgi:hypothetical protein